jgi:hypothetical protein
MTRKGFGPLATPVTAEDLVAAGALAEAAALDPTADPVRAGEAAPVR